MEADEVDPFAFTVLRHLQQIDDAEEAGFARQLGRDIRETDRLDGIDFDLAFFHLITGPDFYVRAHPDADAAGDFSAANSLTEAFREHHYESLHRPGPELWRRSTTPRCRRFVQDAEWRIWADYPTKWQL